MAFSRGRIGNARPDIYLEFVEVAQWPVGTSIGFQVVQKNNWMSGSEKWLGDYGGEAINVDPASPARCTCLIRSRYHEYWHSVSCPGEFHQQW